MGSIALGALLPLVTAAYLAYAAGLIAGFTGFVWCLAGGTVTLITAALRNTVATDGALLLFAAGALIGSTTPRPPAYHSATPPTTQGFLSQTRVHASATIDTTFRADAPLAKALLVADQHEIPKDIRDTYTTAGIIHMLSISGLHVAIIAATIELLFHLMRLPPKTASIVAVAIIALYIAIIGYPPPAVRSGVMLATVAASRILQRPTSRWAALALGGAFPLLLDPATVLDLGYQLSVGGMAGLIASGALARRLVHPYLEGWQRSLASGLLASCVATIVSAPLVSWAFGRISIIAPLTNLVADPILGLAQPILFLALVLAPVHPVARFLADAVHPLLAAFNTVATYGAAVPYASITVTPQPITALLSGLASVAITVACVSRFPARAMLLAAGALCAIPWIT